MIGKLIGAFLGVALIHGWLGFGVGLLIGHFYDRYVARLRAPSLGAGYIEPVFAFAGALAKSDGRVSEREIAAAEALMERLRLNPEQRRVAVERFTAGKQAGFDVAGTVAELRAWCRGRGDRAMVVLDPLLDLIYAEGPPSPAKAALVRQLCAALGVSEQTFVWLAAMKGYVPVATAAGPRPGGPRPGGARPPPTPAAPLDPYAVLGVARTADERTVKHAYRKLISQHHPDKLGDVPEELKRRAERRAGEINAAWESIKEARGFK
ncbi:co-chaperone DjlA [Dokdonella sp.]|uniref:co-chaperone DjlA n=1 Tax=Dokdonella sp. TaxID=2291710 RepID=UPI0031BDB7C5|nr:co-chaperone DjlA [Dokdonella sp.]